MTEKNDSVIAVIVRKTHTSAVRFKSADGVISYETVFDRETPDMNVLQNAVREIASTAGKGSTADGVCSIGFAAADNHFYALPGAAPIPDPALDSSVLNADPDFDPDFDFSGLLENRMSAEEIYRRTGHILKADSPLVRFFADRGKHFFDTVLDTPGMLVHMLTGTAALERTAVSGAGLLALENLDYDRDIELELGLCSYNFPAIVTPGTIIGQALSISPDKPESRINVTAVCSHTAACAMITAPEDAVCVIAEEDSVKIGVSLPFSPRTELCETYGFSIEAGYGDCFNLIKNVHIRENLDCIEGETAISGTSDKAAICGILPRIAGEIAGITGRHYKKLCIMGSGAGFAGCLSADCQSAELPEFEIIRVPFDAAAAGNALVQFIANGVFPDIETARQALFAPFITSDNTSNITSHHASNQREALTV